MTLLALALAAITPVIDRHVPYELIEQIPLAFSGQADGARAVLSTIATSAIGVAGVVFSMTIVTLQLASSQFGPRLLRTFLRDTGTQLALGTFLGTFIYCIVVLPTVATSEDSQFVPHVSVTVAVALAIASLAMLVYYIDHVAQSIHADAVMESVGSELCSVIDNLFPEEVGADADEALEQHGGLPPCDGDPSHVRSVRGGYVRFINAESLLTLASENNLFIVMRSPPGAFVMRDDLLAEVWPEPSAPMQKKIQAAFVLGAHRTTLQDILFTFEQVSEVAVRALSPGINDPTTAVHCLDQIGAGLTRLVARKLPSKWRTDTAGTVRIEIEPVALHEILNVTVVAISRSADVHLPVWLRMLEILQTAARRARRPRDVETLHQCARQVALQAESQLQSSMDRQRFSEAATWTRSDEPDDAA
jgi:uncharacterized membrane protein